MSHTQVIADYWPLGAQAAGPTATLWVAVVVSERGVRSIVRICYVDEAGCTGALPHATSPVQPVFAICGLVFEQRDLQEITREFIHLKSRHFPRLAPSGGHYLHWILPEVKGSEVRKDAVDSSRRVRRAAIGFLDRILELVEAYALGLDGRVWVKGIGEAINGMAMYHSSIHFICDAFNASLERDEDYGLVICDGRNKPKNSALSFSIFTSKYRAVGDRCPRILEVPTFGHSENHAAVQVADLVCSAMLFPMAADAYCAGHIVNSHVRAGYDRLRDRYGPRLLALQSRSNLSRDSVGRRAGGIVVSDRIGQRSYHEMFRSRTAGT